MVRAGLTRWLCAPAMSGWGALLFGVAAVCLPTLVRLAVSGVVTGCEFTPYLPFVLLCAILLPWWVAGAVALMSVAVMGGMFGGALTHPPSCFVDSAIIFCASSSVMIGVAIIVRRTVAALQRRGPDESAGGIIFSLEKGEVWASWYGQASPMLLGSQRRVSEMMKDFLKQDEVAKRLNAKA
jgi:hypothetical protein